MKTLGDYSQGWKYTKKRGEYAEKMKGVLSGTDGQLSTLSDFFPPTLALILSSINPLLHRKHTFPLISCFKPSKTPIQKHDNVRFSEIFLWQ